MIPKIRVGSKVMYNNLVCLVVDIERKGSKEYLELQPVGSSARISADSSQVTHIMNEGTRDRQIESPLYD